jgi:hypothetical protein
LHSNCGKKTLVFGKHPICVACKQNEIDESVANDFQGRGEYRKLTFFGKRKGKGKQKNVNETDSVKMEELLLQEDKEEEKNMKLKSLKDIDKKYLEQCYMLDAIY